MLGSSHQFLSKPCDIGLLVDTIDAAIATGREQAASAVTLINESNRESDKNTVLLIESSLMQSRLIAERIRALSEVEVVTAHTLAEAVKILETERSRVFMCVTAMFLPDAEGTEIVDFAHACSLPCVVLTSSHDEGLQSRSRTRPILDYFLKNDFYEDRQLFDLIRRTYDNGAISVLVVDDSPTDLQIVCKFLETMNFRVSAAGSGAEAVSALRNAPNIRIVITDNEMPGLTGVDLTTKLRQEYPEDEMVIIGMSSASKATARFLKAGCNDFIKKPFSAEEFYCRVQ